MAQAAADPRRLLTGHSVIFLFLHGGPSQFETFDPKMSAPAEIRSTTGEISTAIPGVTFGSTFPKLAQMVDRLSIVRSFTTGNANHDIKPVVSRHTGGANLGSYFCARRGGHRSRVGHAAKAALVPRAVDTSTGPEQTQFGRFASTGSLGAGCAPFVPGAGGDLQQDMQLNLPVDRLDDRRALLSELDRVRWLFDATGQAGTLDKLREQAFSSVLKGVAQAFDLAGRRTARDRALRHGPLGPARPDQSQMEELRALRR